LEGVGNTAIEQGVRLSGSRNTQLFIGNTKLIRVQRVNFFFYDKSFPAANKRPLKNCREKKFPIFIEKQSPEPKRQQPGTGFTK
jgi:hypothetical protein